MGLVVDTADCRCVCVTQAASKYMMFKDALQWKINQSKVQLSSVAVSSRAPCGVW